MDMYRRFMFFAAGIIAMLAASSCEGMKQGEDVQAEQYYLEFVHESDALQEFTNDFQGTYDMPLNTNVPKKFLKVSSVDDQVWCSADIREDGGAVLITPGKAVSGDLQATFIIEVTSGGEEIQPLTFVVKRLFETIVPSISVSLNGQAFEEDYPMVEVSGNAQTLTFSVQTNAPRWKVEYDNYTDDEWVSVDKVSGRNGETVTISLSKNDSGDTRNQTFKFSPAIADSDVSVSVTVIQKAWSAIESVVVREFNASAMTPGAVMGDDYQVVMPNGNTARAPFCFCVEINGAGAVDVKFAEVGSNQLGYCDWAFSGRKAIEDEEGKAIGYYYFLYSTQNTPGEFEGNVVTGEERSVDVVIVPDGLDVELYRFRLTQEAFDSQNQ